LEYYEPLSASVIFARPSRTIVCACCPGKGTCAKAHLRAALGAFFERLVAKRCPIEQIRPLAGFAPESLLSYFPGKADTVLSKAAVCAVARAIDRQCVNKDTTI
jgi:hypothetical protein